MVRGEEDREDDKYKPNKQKPQKTWEIEERRRGYGRHEEKGKKGVSLERRRTGMRIRARKINRNLKNKVSQRTQTKRVKTTKRREGKRKTEMIKTRKTEATTEQRRTEEREENNKRGGKYKLGERAEKRK